MALEVFARVLVMRLPAPQLKALIVLIPHDRMKREMVGENVRCQVSLKNQSHIDCLFILTKNIISDREKEASETVTSPIEQTSQPPKRPRINRNRYPSGQPHALAKKLLPIDPQAGDKSRSGRKE